MQCRFRSKIRKIKTAKRSIFLSLQRITNCPFQTSLTPATTCPSDADNSFRMKIIFVIFAIAFCIVTQKSTGKSNTTGIYKRQFYSAFDSASWAVTSENLSPVLGVHKQILYDNYIAACDKALEDEICGKHDKARMRMNQAQPSSVYNYTKNGYAKTRVPPDLYELIKNVFDSNRDKAKIEWKEYNVYHNAWESPPTFIDLHKHYADGTSVTSKIEEKVKPILERWTGQRLSPVSTYGIRLYHNGSILAPHVDRMPLVTSAIIQVDQDVDEPWPLEVYGHDGTATNVTMEPGEMVLYESHSVIHGRPFPMIGNFFANCFIHFEPYEPIEGESLYDPELDLPPYLKTGSAWAKDWKTSNPRGWKGNLEDIKTIALFGDAQKLESRILKDPEEIHRADANGWTVLHEASRIGRLETVKTLLKHGASENLLTYTGVTPLNIARQFLKGDHELIAFLESIDAKDISPSRSKKRHEEL